VLALLPSFRVLGIGEKKEKEQQRAAAV
jgi:hypothetical protein